VKRRVVARRVVKRRVVKRRVVARQVVKRRAGARRVVKRRVVARRGWNGGRARGGWPHAAGGHARVGTRGW